MKTVLLIGLIAGTVPTLFAQGERLAASSGYLSPVEEAPSREYTFAEDDLVGQAPLIKPQKAQIIVNLFRAVYPDLGSPRYLIYVNRKTVDDRRLIRRCQLIYLAKQPSRTNIVFPVKDFERQVYRGDGQIQPTTADAQTAREVELLFSRPLRAARAIVLSEKAVNQLVSGHPIDDVISFRDSPKVVAQREVLNRGADVILEILLTWRVHTVPTISGTQTLTVPEIVVTAIQLRTGKIIGQASSSDVTADVPLNRLATYDIRQVAEVTCLSLMRDMATNWRKK